MVNLKKDKKEFPRMAAIRSDHYSNLVGSVDLFTYFKKYKVEWNYRKKVIEKSKYDGKIREIWRLDKKSKEIEFFSDHDLAISKFKEIFIILRDKEEKVNQNRYEQRLRDDEEQKVNRMVELKDMNLRVLNAIKEYIQSVLCLKCRRPNVRFKIDEDTGEFYGICLTCNYKNTLPDLLLKEKELRIEYEARRKQRKASMQKCPYCGELIEKHAIKCNNCDADLNL